MGWEEMWRVRVGEVVNGVGRDVEGLGGGNGEWGGKRCGGLGWGRW